MAYGNWGAFVYRNGDRMKDNEDASPFPKREGDGFVETFHAVLGNGRVRLIGYKHTPKVYVDGVALNMDRFVVAKPGVDNDEEFVGEVQGYEFKAAQHDGNMVDLWLKEPDGTQWNATCGYCYGAGHMD